MININVSVTQSIEIQSINLPANDIIIYNIDNPLNYTSYFILKTVPNSNGFYDNTSPENLEGSFSLGEGIIEIINDEYKAGIIVSPGGGELTFIPINNIISSSLMLQGTN
jgi:hypothetical protein